MAETKLNPLIAAAAVSVIIFSAVGVGVMAGLIPSSKSSNDALTPVQTKPADTSASPGSSPPAPQASSPAYRAPEAQPPRQVATYEPAPVTNAVPPPPSAPGMVAAVPPPPPAAAPCKSCGVIDGVNVIEKKGSGGPVGVVGGALVGGLLGNQIGRGHGNTAATVIGAVGGAVAGNEVEKHVNSTKEYRVTVRMDDGHVRHFTYRSAPPYAPGERVRVVNGHLSRA